MNRKKEIQPWRYAGISLAFFGLLLPKIGLFTGADGALGIVLATGILCLLHRFRIKIVGRKNGSVKGIAAKLLAAVRMLWYIAVLVILIGLLSYLMRDCFWPGMSVGIAFGIVLIMLFPALGKQKQVWQRITAVSFVWILLVTAGIPVLAVRQIQLLYVDAVMTIHPANVAAAALFYLVLSWYLLLIPEAKNRGMWPDSREGLYLLNGLFLAGLCVLTGLVYGPQGAGARRWPLLSLLQGVSVPGKFVERVDAIWSAVCIMALFLGIGLLLERFCNALTVLGGDKCTIRPRKYRDLAAFVLLALVVLAYRYQGVEAQDRAYVSTFMADRDDHGFVFWFPQQTSEEPIYAVHADNVKQALEILDRNSRKQPDFGHIRATILGDALLADEISTGQLFADLAAWQDMDENSYVYRCEDPEKLLSADTEDTVLGIYLSELYENHFGPDNSHPVLRELLTAWQNGNRDFAIPCAEVEDTLTITVSKGQSLEK